MIVRLFCPQCTFEATKGLPRSVVPVLSPVSRLSDNGEYEVTCSVGHVSTVVLDNLKFELLFDMGINALIDGYPREAVSSFAACLERFQEFAFRVAMAHSDAGVDSITDAWKLMSRQSERQLGAYIAAMLVLTKEPPRVLSPGKQVSFRNDVVHAGYVPTDQEAIDFGDAVLLMVYEALDVLRSAAPEALVSTYAAMAPKSKVVPPEEFTGRVNVLTTIDVRHPPTGEDIRAGGVKSQFARILHDRVPHGLELLSREEMEKLHPGIRLKP
jgi:hypothetical protein